MINELKTIQTFIEKLQDIDPMVCQLPTNVLLYAANAHNIISDLMERIEHNDPIINPCDLCESRNCEECSDLSEFMYHPSRGEEK